MTKYKCKCGKEKDFKKVTIVFKEKWVAKEALCEMALRWKKHYVKLMN